MSPEESHGKQNNSGADQAIELPGPRSHGVELPVILVADDEPLVRKLVTVILQQSGYTVFSAADGHEGLELSRKYPGTIDLVVTDVDMPRLNGTDLCGHLIEERPGIKMLIMSGGDRNGLVSHNSNVPFLSKPFFGDALISKVRSILAAPRQPTEETVR